MKVVDCGELVFFDIKGVWYFVCFFFFRFSVFFVNNRLNVGYVVFIFLLLGVII